MWVCGEQGSGEAALELGIMFEDGNGVGCSYEKAAHYYMVAMQAVRLPDGSVRQACGVQGHSSWWREMSMMMRAP